MVDLIILSIDNDFSLQVNINPWFLFLIFIGFCIVLLVRRRFINTNTNFEIDEAEIGIGDQKIKLKPNLDDLQIAFKLWCELNTRKIGIPIDEENDVIVQVYDSWHEFFQITRELVKSIPVSKLRKNKSTRQLVRISMHILNKELRPHLTKWQSRYRYWYDNLNNEGLKNSSPQELQQTYPEYREIIEDMKNVNTKMVAYTKILKRLVYKS